MAFLIGRQAGLRSANDSVDQLMEQLSAARAELREAQMEYAAKIERTKAYFDKEATQMRLEFAEALAELDQLRLAMFHKWTRSETERLH